MPQTVLMQTVIDDEIQAGASLNFYVDDSSGTFDMVRPISRTRARPRSARDQRFGEQAFGDIPFGQAVGFGGYGDGRFGEHGFGRNENLVSHRFGNFYGPAGSNGYLQIRTAILDVAGRVAATTPPDTRVNLDSSPLPATAFRLFGLSSGQMVLRGEASRAIINDDGSAR